MAWYNPATWWTVGQIVIKDVMDSLIRDNLRYLHGDDGAITLANALILPDGAGYYLHIPVLTTTQRNALTPTAGMLIYNSTTTQFNKYEAGGWRADLGFNSDHGNLTAASLLDDDHTQYQKENLLTTAGDLPYATGAGVWSRLGIGGALQFLRTNALTTAPEWVNQPAGINIVSSSYTGNDANDRQITTGFACKLVFLLYPANYFWACLSTDNAVQFGFAGNDIAARTDVLLHAADGFVVDKTEANWDTIAYYYVAIG